MITRAYCYGPPASWRDAETRTGAFHDWLQARGRSASTRRVYLAAVRRWWVYARSSGTGNTEAALRGWLSVRRRCLSAASVNTEIAALRAWQVWAREAAPELCIAGLDAVRVRRVPQRLPRFLAADQVDALLASIPSTTWHGVRDTAIVAVMWECGLRPREVTELGIGDVHADGLLLPDRYVPASSALLDLLDRWQCRRREVRPGKRSVLFVSSRGLPLRGAGAIWAILRRYTRAQSGGPSPSWLRAGMATALLQRGCPLTAVSQMLGHRSAISTQRYSTQDLEVMRAAVARLPRHRLPSPTPGAAEGSDDVG